MSWRKKSSLDWLRALPGVSQDEPLASRTSFGIGGPAEFFVESGRVEAIERTIARCAEREIPYLPLRAGTHMLIADARVEGPVIPVGHPDHPSEGTRAPARAGPKMMRVAPPLA